MREKGSGFFFLFRPGGAKDSAWVHSTHPTLLFRPGGAKEIFGPTRLLRMLRARNCPLTPAPSPSVGRGERWATPSHGPAIPPPRRGGCVKTNAPTGCATPKTASLHPRLQSAAPLGRKRQFQVSGSQACPFVASWRLCVRSPTLPWLGLSLCILHSAFFTSVPGSPACPPGLSGGFPVPAFHPLPYGRPSPFLGRRKGAGESSLSR